MKSDAKVVGLPELKTAAQVLEDILDDWRDNPEAVDREAVNKGLGQFDQVRGAYEVWQGATESAVPDLVPEAISEPIREEATAPVAPAPPPLPAKQPAARPTSAAAMPEESFTVRVPSERLDRMLNLAGELGISQQSGEEVSQRLLGLSELLEHYKREPGEFFDNPAGLMEMLQDHVRRIEGELRKKRGREELLVEALENDIRQARLLPLVMLADSLRRAVRDLSQSLGKPIAYHADVGSILLDKAVIEALKDPLVHMMRNAADHGIESPAEREAAGKPPEGSIRISATCRGQLVRITITDDGRGVDFRRIREKLAKTGELTSAEIAGLSEIELSRYLFKAGFSTAARGEVSGRGVGLDVVLDTVRRLQGRVELEASSSAGTAFALTVPVTVSTVRILTVQAGGQSYGVPSSAVIRTGRAKREDLRELEGSLVLPINGQPVRWAHLSELVGKPISTLAQNGHSWSYLLLSGNNRSMAVAVDDLEEEAEVILKPLGYPLTGLMGLVGAAIRADGSVQLVLDLTDRAFTKAAGTRSRPAEEAKTLGRVLVVDDSPTTRAVLRNVFTVAGYAVTTASDGMDALERLAAITVDVVISDVEMPRLNGFDLTRQIKSKFGLPVILVTGREDEQYRREGLEAGADAYVVKSTFKDTGLLEIVEQFV
jgi:two-component system chemotaxis sensor kinase CheA